MAISAPKGAIRKGQTLTIEKGTPKKFPALGATSIAGGPFTISTSQGEPAKPVKITFHYHPGMLSSGDQPLILHGWSAFGNWVPEETNVNSSNGTVSAQLESFSPIDVAGDITWAAGDITGNRTNLPSGCGAPPSWIDGVNFPDDRNDSLPACTGTESNANTLYIHIANHRGYTQFVTISNATLDVHQSNWSDSLEGLFANQIAAHSPGNSPSSFVLAPGSHATLAIDKPPESIGNTAVSLRAAPQGASATAEMGWALLKKTQEEISVPVGIANCVIGHVYNTLSANPSAASAINHLRICTTSAVGLSGTAKKALAKIASAILVTDFFYKLIDLEANEAYPPELSFSIRGKNPTNPDIHVGNLSYGSLPAGQQTIEHLTATGGTPPYSYFISHAAANTANVPPWVRLAPDGTLTIDPPAGTNQSVSFYVYATDAVGQDSPYERDLVTFSVTGGGGGSGMSWTSTEAPLPGNAGTEPSVTFTSVTCPAVDFCVAVGTYNNSSGTPSGLIETLSNGTRTPTEAPLPADADPEDGGYPNLGPVACSSAGSCFIIGEYDTANGSKSLLETLSNGVWAPTEVPLPANASANPRLALSTVACPPGGSCVIIGVYDRANEHSTPLIEALVNGSWIPTEGPLPPDADSRDPAPGFFSMTCPAVGSCVAVGDYYKPDGSRSGLIETLSNGTWTPTEAPLPPEAASDRYVDLRSVGCATSASCVVTGESSIGGADPEQGLIETLSNGTWTPTEAPLPPGSDADAYARFSIGASAACSAANSCVAVGLYASYTANNHWHGLIETLSNGTWLPLKAPLPTDTGSAALLVSVTCPAAGSCVAIGDFSSISGDVYPKQGLIETLVNGSWIPTEGPVPPGSDSSAYGQTLLNLLACPAEESCVALGGYRDEKGAFQGLIETSGPGP